MIKEINTAIGVYSKLPRYREILGILYRYGFGDMLKLIRLQKSLNLDDDDTTDPVPTAPTAEGSPAVRFRQALEELGPTFIKFGQILSSRRDLIDETLFIELRKLQATVPPFDGQEAIRIIESELGRPIEELFREFDETPLASASLAQVHRAVARGGDVLAIKVQRPGIAKVIEGDVEILLYLATFLENHVESLAAINPVGVVKEFTKTLLKEQDFTIEAHNLEHFAKNFSTNRTIRIPRIYRELSTEKVLTMEYFRGYPVDMPENLRKHGLDPVKIANRMSKLIFQQIFQHGYFHGDPHPGNLTILNGNIIAFYDYGMMGRLTPAFQENIASMIMGLSQKDHNLVTRSILGMSIEGVAEDTDKLERDVESFAGEHLDVPMKELKLGFVLNRLLEVLMNHKLRMKPEFYLGVKALTQVEAIGQVLDPDLNFNHIGEPYAREVMERKWSLPVIMRSLMDTLGMTIDAIKIMPREMQDIYQRLKSGKMNIPVDIKISPEGFEPLRKTLNHIANRISQALVLSSLLVLSGLLFVARVPPLWHGIPVFALVAVGIAFLSWLRHWITIRRRGGL